MNLIWYSFDTGPRWISPRALSRRSQRRKWCSGKFQTFLYGFERLHWAKVSFPQGPILQQPSYPLISRVFDLVSQTNVLSHCSLALIEMRLILAHMVFSFDTKRTADASTKDWVHKQKNLFIVWEKSPLPVELVPVVWILDWRDRWCVVAR